MAEKEKEITVKNYLEYLTAKKLMGSKCGKCGEIRVPPRKICPKCNSTNTKWMEMSGKGKIAAFSCISVGTQLFVDKGYSNKNPYCFSIIKLDDGPMISAQLVGVDETKPDTIKIDTPVKVKFLETSIKGEIRVDLGFEPLK